MELQFLLKEKAVALRKLGKSYGEIKKELDVSKSTLSYWLKGIRLKQEDKERLYTKQIKVLSKGSTSQKERRGRVVRKIISNSLKEVKLPISNEIYKFFGVALYWAEGSKCKTMQITNSDPYLILFMVKWLSRIFQVQPINLKANLNIYSQQDEVKIKQFWSELTSIPVANFGKSYIKPLSKNYKKNNLYYGTIRIYVQKSTDMKYRMFGWLQAILQEMNPDVKLVQKKWLILRKAQRPLNLSKDN